jgi:hypothetical protein
MIERRESNSHKNAAENIKEFSQFGKTGLRVWRLAAFGARRQPDMPGELV